MIVLGHPNKIHDGIRESEFVLCDFFDVDVFDLSTAAEFLSLSISCVFKEDNSGQKKMLIPEGKSGVSQRKSQFQRQEVNDDDGWNAMFSMCRQCINNSLALN